MVAEAHGWIAVLTDALDCAGVWNVAKIISIPSASEVEVSYDGWGSEYDEIILINDGRVAPYHTYTWVVRSWVKYLNWPWWPALVTMRQAGTLEGMENLRAENRLFVDFADKRSFEKRHRFWVDKTKIMPWQDRLYENRARTTGADFELSYLITMESAASDVFPSFAEGTLCEQFADSVAHSVASTKKTMGHDLWVRQFATNRERHNLVHRYKETNDDDDTAEEDVAVLQTISSDESDDAKTPPKKKGKQTVGVQRKRKNGRCWDRCCVIVCKT
ncbi:TPA: hypothetical protein N0F65_006257 [Lagenidium giganteum]|uniref:PWWP domain-containing protein n=1 Tax=Lagenidium giganteum TaxID=4803 RepID=A0AAV2Z3N9_9STRA|nr:TPA: hypothetical protein N0F65_006257 [Lagenidium giganteum]